MSVSGSEGCWWLWDYTTILNKGYLGVLGFALYERLPSTRRTMKNLVLSEHSCNPNEVQNLHRYRRFRVLGVDLEHYPPSLREDPV